ncbi:MAG: Gfo/Idh/MocA family oxidoreductase [Anaerolineae bacterium]|nr:Gfo/Idh/MocA family oxidoreductase [Anaerolineae bacterium]
MRVGVWSFAHLHAYGYVRALRALRVRGGIDWLGITDEDPERGARVARELDLPFVEDPANLLDRVDAVVITSANADHHDMALQAARAGVHALVEKPIATTVADAQEMIDAFDRAGLILGTAFPCPFSPAFEELRQLVRSGELGRVLALRTTNRGSMPGGFFIQLERSGGGAVIDHTVHVADLLRRLTGAEYVRVYAEIGHGLFHQEWDDSGFLTMDLSNGSFATLDCSWSRPKSFPTWGDVTLRVIGEKGNAYADLFGQHIHYYPAKPEPPSWQPWGSNLDELMIEDFLQAVREKRPPRSTGIDGLRALEVALAAYASARQSRAVEIAELY